MGTNTQRFCIQNANVTYFKKRKKCLNVSVDTTCGINYECFYRDMTNLIQSSINVTGYVDAIVSDFSTTTPTHRIVSEITVMASTQQFFEYCLRTECGIPYVELLGSKEDWVKLKTKLASVRKLLQPIDEVIIPAHWWDRIEYICNKLIETVDGTVDKEWWGQILTYEQHGFGSGSYVTYDGWFLRDMLNISGEVESFHSIPSGLVSIPITFDQHGMKTNGAVVSGMAGITIDQSKTVPVVSSAHGWTIFK